MKIVFGLSLDRPLCPLPADVESGVLYTGPHRLLLTLEGYLGLSQEEKDVDYLRIEQYRQALLRYVERVPEVFFSVSFRADPFATATELLSRRDEFVLAGWDFTFHEDTPPRLIAMAEVEAALAAGDAPLAMGFADRFDAVLKAMEKRRHPIAAIETIEPRTVLPVHWRRFLQVFERHGGIVSQGPMYEAIQSGMEEGKTDLQQFQRLLLQGPEKGARLKGDGSLILLKGKRDTDLAAFLASWMRRTPSWKPVLLLPDLSGALDYALVQEGMPSLGLQSASLARPALQALKLIPVFLWQPLDPFIVLEFVSLSIKPLEEELASRIAKQMAQTPGVFSESWQAMLAQYFRDMEEGGFVPSEDSPEEIRRQYRMWFDRRRYDSAGQAPKEEALAMFRYLEQWAARKHEKGQGSMSMLILRVQARRIAALLEALPEDRLTRLELERIVRTIYEAAPLQLRQQEQGSCAYAQQAGAIPKPVDDLVWWNFSQTDPDFIFSRWTQAERDYLTKWKVVLDHPQEQNALLLWQRKRPVLLARERLVLVMPELTEGKEVQPHPLLGDLEAGFENWTCVLADIDAPGRLPSSLGSWPLSAVLSYRQLGVASPFIHIHDRVLQPREKETFTSLETMLYYPYQWVFRYVLRLYKSAILSIVPDRTLFGNLAHRFFEKLLQQPGLDAWNKDQVAQFIADEAPQLLNREGAVLLLYGREPERIQFIKKVQFAAQSLVDLLQGNGWQVEATEHPVVGVFAGLELTGRADVVLRRGPERAVLDFKWSGAMRREMSIRNREDLQPALYAHLLEEVQTGVHTAFFIMENGRMIARNQAAFKGAIAVEPDSNHMDIQQEILRRMQATFEWRVDQFRQGRIEVRTAQTQAALEAQYEESLLDILEMRRSDAPFDDYRTLINAIS